MPTTPSGIVVTGASTGIGRAMSLLFAEKGSRVFACVRDLSSAPEHALIVPVRLDVTDAEEAKAAADQVAQSGVDVSGLVNNAGIAVGGPLESMSLDDLRRQLEVNLVGQLAVTQAFLPLLRRNRGGRIVFTGSVSGKVAVPFLGPYVASKHALAGLAGSLRRELKPEGIGVSLLVAGTISTPIWDKGTADADQMDAELPAEVRDRYDKQLTGLRKVLAEAPGRGIPPEAVASVAWKALTDARPRAEYLVGTEAKVVARAARLPAPVLDLLLDKQLNG